MFLQHERHRNEPAGERRLRVVREHGHNGLSLLTLYDGWRYFEPPDLDGFVAFELHRNTAVVCADPVCAEAELPGLMRRFVEHCRAQGWRFAFVGASERAGRAAAALGWRALKIGEEPLLDLRTYSLRGRGAKKARSATNLARRTGVSVEEYTGDSPATDAEIEEVARAWLDSRKAPPMGFLLRSRPLSGRQHKRIFLARQEDRLVAVMTCAPMPARGLLYVEEQLRRPDAPYGTTELLIEAARRTARDEGYALLSLGTAPLQGAERQPLGRFPLMSALVRALTSKLNFVYSFRSLNHYKRKFAPSSWEDNFFIYRGSIVPVAIAAASAFAPDGLPSLMLPKRLQWLRLVPAAALWASAAAGVALTAFAAYEFLGLTLPVREALAGLELARLPLGFTVGHTRGAVAAHRIVSALVVSAAAVGVAWQRRARA